MRKARGEDVCCTYRKSLAKKKEAQSRKKPRSVTTNGCCAGKKLTCDEISKVAEEPSTSLRCGGTIKKKIKRIKKPVGCSLEADKILSMIKPSISEREKYVNIKHLVCVLEAEELLRLREVQMIREQLEESGNLDRSEIQNDNEQKVNQTPSSTKSLTTEVSREDNREENDEQVEQTPSSAKSLKTEASNEENQEKNSLTVGGKTSEQIAENKNRDKKVKMTARKSTLENKNECSSICSFDSEIDLSGLHLTKCDLEKIEKNREQIRQQQKSEKYDSENADTGK